MALLVLLIRTATLYRGFKVGQRSYKKHFATQIQLPECLQQSTICKITFYSLPLSLLICWMNHENWKSAILTTYLPNIKQCIP